jgi:signal transduction histidine kinase
MRFKARVMLILILAMIAPILLVSIGSTFYYRDVIKNNIWDNNLAQAKSTSLLTPTYIDSARLYLGSLSDRPLVIQAAMEKNKTYLDETTRYADISFRSAENARIFNEVFITDTSGTVLSSYPHEEIVGRNVMDRPYIAQALLENNRIVSDAVLSNATGQPTVYVAVPINNSTINLLQSHNGAVYGVLVGELNLDNFAQTVIGTQVKNYQYVSIVNRTGHIMVSDNPEFMKTMKNYSSVPAVQSALRGEEGVDEQYNPIEGDWRLAAYSPIKQYGWGVIVAVPVEVAYKPITDTMLYFFALIVILVIVAILLAINIGNYFSKPILDISRAIKEIPRGDYRRYLPLARSDDLGDLARSFDNMAGTIQKDTETITAERDRAELYVDIMGHDINNLNQVAMSNLEVLNDSAELPDGLRPMADHALSAVAGSAGIIENVRKIQKFSSEELRMERIDVSDLINEAIREVSKPPDKNVVIDYSGTKGMYVNAALLLKEAFSNIINNAIKYSGPDVRIDIKLKDTIMDGKKFYEISIADNGPGIPDEVKSKLFRRLQRGTTKARGKGLGLYITKMLVERFGGKVRVEDRVPGDYTKGSKFVILLPAA